MPGSSMVVSGGKQRLPWACVCVEERSEIGEQRSAKDDLRVVLVVCDAAGLWNGLTFG